MPSWLIEQVNVEPEREHWLGLCRKIGIPMNRTVRIAEPAGSIPWTSAVTGARLRCAWSWAETVRSYRVVTEIVPVAVAPRASLIV